MILMQLIPYIEEKDKRGNKVFFIIHFDMGILDWSTQCSAGQDGFSGFFVGQIQRMKPQKKDSIAKVEIY